MDVLLRQDCSFSLTAILHNPEMWTLSYSVKHTIIFFVPPRPGLLNYEIHDNADAHMPLTRLSVFNLVSRLFFCMQRKNCLVNDLLCFSSMWFCVFFCNIFYKMYKMSQKLETTKKLYRDSSMQGT